MPVNYHIIGDVFHNQEVLIWAIDSKSIPYYLTAPGCSHPYFSCSYDEATGRPSLEPLSLKIAKLNSPHIDLISEKTKDRKLTTDYDELTETYTIKLLDVNRKGLIMTSASVSTATIQTAVFYDPKSEEGNPVLWEHETPPMEEDDSKWFTLGGTDARLPKMGTREGETSHFKIRLVPYSYLFTREITTTDGVSVPKCTMFTDKQKAIDKEVRFITYQSVYPTKEQINDPTSEDTIFWSGDQICIEGNINFIHCLPNTFCGERNCRGACQISGHTCGLDETTYKCSSEKTTTKSVNDTLGITTSETSASYTWVVVLIIIIILLFSVIFVVGRRS